MYIFGQFNRHVLGDLEEPGSSEQRKEKHTRPGGRKATTSDSCELPASNRARSCGRSQLAARAAEPGYRATPLRFTAAMYWAKEAIDDLRSDPDWRHHGWRWCPSTPWKLKVDDILCIMDTIWNGNCSISFSSNHSNHKRKGLIVLALFSGIMCLFSSCWHPTLFQATPQLCLAASQCHAGISSFLWSQKPEWKANSLKWLDDNYIDKTHEKIYVHKCLPCINKCMGQRCITRKQRTLTSCRKSTCKCSRVGLLVWLCIMLSWFP